MAMWKFRNFLLVCLARLIRHSFLFWLFPLSAAAVSNIVGSPTMDVFKIKASEQQMFTIKIINNKNGVNGRQIIVGDNEFIT